MGFDSIQKWLFLKRDGGGAFSRNQCHQIEQKNRKKKKGWNLCWANIKKRKQISQRKILNRTSHHLMRLDWELGELNNGLEWCVGMKSVSVPLELWKSNKGEWGVMHHKIQTTFTGSLFSCEKEGRCGLHCKPICCRRSPWPQKDISSSAQRTGESGLLLSSQAFLLSWIFAILGYCFGVLDAWDPKLAQIGSVLGF